MVVVEGATLATFVTGAIAMLIIGILLNIVVLGTFCSALFALATDASPFFVGRTVGICSFHWEQDRLAPSSSVLPLLGSHFRSVNTLSRSRTSPIVRLVIGLLFAVPVTCVRYVVALAFAHI